MEIIIRVFEVVLGTMIVSVSRQRETFCLINILPIANYVEHVDQ